MKTAYIFLAPGFEEIEALATVDILRRGGLEVTTVAVNDSTTVAGAHGVPVVADVLIDNIAGKSADWLVLPGGLPGATNLAACEPLTHMLTLQHKQGRGVAAICASPAFVLAPLGILENYNATCYPGCESAAEGRAQFSAEPVVTAGNVITGKGPGYTFEFALAIVKEAMGADVANDVAAAIMP